MTLQEVRKEIGRLVQIREGLEETEFRTKTLPALLRLGCKTFAYRRSCYSCPEKESDYWDLFRKVLAVIPEDGGAWLVYRELFIDSRGQAIIRTGSQFCYKPTGFDGGWEPCLAREFNAMEKRAMKALQDGVSVASYHAKGKR